MISLATARDEEPVKHGAGVVEWWPDPFSGDLSFPGDPDVLWVHAAGQRGRLVEFEPDPQPETFAYAYRIRDVPP